MSFNNTQLPVELPVYKDKVMYISSTDSNIKMEQSYVISASFNGILRLSPNSYNTIYETNPIELTVEQDNSISATYSDAIVFDDSTLVGTTDSTQETLKANADIRQRMIIGSDSDGYLVSFRIGQEDVEFDNLGVIGITKTGKMTFYTQAHSAAPEVIKIGKTIMPSLPNELENNYTDLHNLLAGIKDDEYVAQRPNPDQWDEIKIDITGEGDKSYLLQGNSDKDGNRIFNYIRSQQFIRDIIMETLLSIQSVPTGSIHWIPVTYEQYEKLVNGTDGKGQSYPNRYYKILDGTETKTPTDPIIRDYLLCDGRKYKSSEFPELAKILWKEKITYWDYNGQMHTHINGGSETNYVEDENGKQVKEITYDDFFRVPDLRTKFISYIYTRGVSNPLEGEPSELDEYIFNPNNITGTYTPDNAPFYAKGAQAGEHFHFSAYGTYSGYNLRQISGEKGTRVGRSNDLYNFKSFYMTDDLSEKTASPRIWYLNNTAASHSEKTGIGGYAYGFGSSGDRRRSQSTNDIMTACAFVSAPHGGHSNFMITPNMGLTSPAKEIYQIPTSNEETYKLTKYEQWDDYNDLESGIAKNNTNTRYGHENAPKFYAMLPLIKI